MRHYGGPTPKRHIAFSNSPTIAKLSMGRLVGWVKAKQAAEREGKPVKKLVSKYKDKSGKLRYKGEKALKSSELGPQLLIVYYFRALQPSSIHLSFLMKLQLALGKRNDTQYHRMDVYCMLIFYIIKPPLPSETFLSFATCIRTSSSLLNSKRLGTIQLLLEDDSWSFFQTLSTTKLGFRHSQTLCPPPKSLLAV